MTFLYGITYPTNVEYGCTHIWEHKEDEQLFFDWIISCAKNAWEHHDHVLQNFAGYFFSHYFHL